VAQRRTPVQTLNLKRPTADTCFSLMLVECAVPDISAAPRASGNATGLPHGKRGRRALSRLSLQNSLKRPAFAKGPVHRKTIEDGHGTSALSAYRGERFLQGVEDMIRADDVTEVVAMQVGPEMIPRERASALCPGGLAPDAGPETYVQPSDRRW
jgi:hypothetical protein